MGMRTELYSLGSETGYPDWAGGEYCLIGSLLIAVDGWNDPRLSGQMKESIAVLRGALAVGDELHELVEREVEAGRIDAREAEQIEVTTHTVELIFRDPAVPWTALDEARRALDGFRELCLDPDLAFEVASMDSYAIPKSRGWDKPPLVASSDAFRKVQAEMIEEIDEVIRDLDQAAAAGASKMMLYYQ